MKATKSPSCLSMKVMEIYEEGDAQFPAGDNFEFSYNPIAFRDSSTGNFLCARTKYRYRGDEKPDPDTLDLIPIPLDEIWPLAWDYSLTQPPNPLPSNIYIKRPSLLGYEEFRHQYRLSDLILSEVRVWEILRRHPHPNIARYQGTIVEDERIVGLCFAKYGMTLAEWVQQISSRPLDKTHCFERINKGIQHLHSLGLIHNDVQSIQCHVHRGWCSCAYWLWFLQGRGGKLGMKAGTMGWTDEAPEIAVWDDDYYRMHKLEEYLEIHLSATASENVQGR